MLLSLSYANAAKPAIAAIFPPGPLSGGIYPGSPNLLGQQDYGRYCWHFEQEYHCCI